jgi:hypothetical protein
MSYDNDGPLHGQFTPEQAAIAKEAWEKIGHFFQPWERFEHEALCEPRINHQLRVWVCCARAWEKWVAMHPLSKSEHARRLIAGHVVAISLGANVTKPPKHWPELTKVYQETALEMGLPEASPASILEIQAGEYKRGEGLPGDELAGDMEIGQSPPDQSRDQLIAFYNSTRRDDRYEPEWILPPFDEVFSGGSLPDDPHLLVEENDIRLFENPMFGARILHGGFKVGTTSWVFMGRRHADVVDFGDGLVGIYRPLPEKAKVIASLHGFPPTEAFWALYRVDDPGLLFDHDVVATLEELREAAAYYSGDVTGRREDEDEGFDYLRANPPF